MPDEIVPPRRDRDAFNCPFADCGAFAQVHWSEVLARSDLLGLQGLGVYEVAECYRCKQWTVWLEKELIYPRTKQIGPKPNPDMPEAVRDVYVEASEVGSISKKSAAGLLRLALQMLVNELEEGSANLNDKIGALVKRGLSPLVQQSMDSLRVFGNESVHPGEINLDEDPEVVPTLFALLNIITEQMISQPKQVQSMYELLPESKREQIERRDQPSE